MPIQANTSSYTAADDVDDRPAQSTTKASATASSGWAAAEQMPSATGDFPTEVRFVEGETQVFKIIDREGPFAVYRQHFLNKSGKRSYVCLGEGCPLCVTLNDKAENKRAFTVINLSAEGGPKRQILVTGARLFQSLYNAEHSKYGPLSNGFWAISRTGKQAQTAYNVTFVKERDLAEDWDLDPVAAAAVVDTAEPYTLDVVRETSLEELQQIADALK